MRVFLDTNVLVSAFTTRGLCADLLRLVLAGHEPLSGEIILQELRRVLDERFRVPRPITGDIFRVAAQSGCRRCQTRFARERRGA